MQSPVSEELLEVADKGVAPSEYWDTIEIVQIVSKLNDSAKITDKQAAEMLKFLESEDSQIRNLPRYEVTESQIAEIILACVKKNFGETPRPDPLRTFGRPLHAESLRELCYEADSEPRKAFICLCLKFVRRSLENAAMNKSRSRALGSRNYSVKKYIFDVPQALELMKSLGFVESAEAGARAILISAEKAEFLGKTGVLEEIDTATELMRSKDAWEEHMRSRPRPKPKPSALLRAPGEGARPDTEVLERGEAGKEEKRAFCVEKCGFFGTKETQGLCSNCYKTRKSAMAAKTAPRKRLRRAVKRLALVQWWAGLARTQQGDCSRCWKCKRKIGFLLIRCECRYYFCPRHRSALEHDCRFDYKKRFETRLIRENPLIASKKVDGV